jgi:tRNA modification GTPase
VPPSYYSTRSTSSTYQDHVLPLSTSQKPTIFALASAPGRAGVAVIRVSGPDALKAYEMMVITSSGSSATAPEPWKMRRCQLVHPATKEELDDGLCVFFPGTSVSAAMSRA